jgi:hypothetical protein
MSSDGIILDALKLAHSLVWENLRPTTDAATVLRLRELVHSPSVRSALERGTDGLPTFALRDVARVLTDQSQTLGETLARIRKLLDQPHLNDALGLRQNRWITFRPRPRNL